MANFKIVIETGNAAFEGEAKNGEIARILRDVATQLDNEGWTSGACYDVNGNSVGWYGERDVRADDRFTEGLLP